MHYYRMSKLTKTQQFLEDFSRPSVFRERPTSSGSLLEPFRSIEGMLGRKLRRPQQALAHILLFGAIRHKTHKLLVPLSCTRLFLVRKKSNFRLNYCAGVCVKGAA